MHSNGDFVVSWSNEVSITADTGIFAQRYDAVGLPQGGEIRVSPPGGGQGVNSVAMDSAENFVVAWGANAEIYAHRYNAAGEPQGDYFQVNTYTANNQFNACVAIGAQGNFAVTWTSDGQDGSGTGIYAQAFNAVGNPQGAEFRVNTYTAGIQRTSRIAMDPTGRFVVTWESFGQDGDGLGVFAQRYRPGVPQVQSTQVNDGAARALASRA